MTVITNQPGLRPNDYPIFESTVGNSFASSIPDQVEDENRQLDKLEAVSGGLFRIYENVIKDASDGAPMTPQDSAIIANTVANMTASVGVECFVHPIASLESHYAQHMGLVLTQESLGKTILATIKRFFDAFMRLMNRITEWVKLKVRKLLDNSPRLRRALNTLNGISPNIVGVVELDANNTHMQVDGVLPTDLPVAFVELFEHCTYIVSQDVHIVDFADELLITAKGSRGEPMERRLNRLNSVVKNVPELKLPRVSNSTTTDSARVSWSKPLLSNTVAVCLNPKTDNPIDAMNYGIALVPMMEANQFGVTAKYIPPKKYPEGEKKKVFIKGSDILKNAGKIKELNNKYVETISKVRDHILKLDDIMHEVSKAATEIAEEEYREHNRVVTSNSKAVGTYHGGVYTDPDKKPIENLLTYLGVARALVTSLASNIESTVSVYDVAAESLVKILNMFVNSLNKSPFSNFDPTADMEEAMRSAYRKHQQKKQGDSNA